MTLFCCQNSGQSNSSDESTSEGEPEILVGKRNVIEEIAGSAYLLSATEYFVVESNDTSVYRPIIHLSNDGSSVGLDFNIPYRNDQMTFDERVNDLTLILAEATKEYNLDSLKSISIGRLILTGDLAIEVAKEYTAIYGDDYSVSTNDYSMVSDFLVTSSLGLRINQLLMPYNLTSSVVNIEKVFFTNLSELRSFVKISGTPSDTSLRVLDCIAHISIRNI